MLKTPTLVFILALTVSCATSGNIKLTDQAIIDQIQVGESTKGQVLALLGEATGVQEIQDHGMRLESWSYHYASAYVNPWVWVPGIGLIALICCDTYQIDSRSLMLRFDEEGILRGRHWGKMDVAAGAGSRTQPAPDWNESY